MKITLEKLHKLTPKKLSAWFDRATSQEIESVTVPCYGDAHSNPYIDYCFTCMYTKWGRMLKPLENDKI